MISFTSDFIPRLVYQYMYSQTGTMHGFIDHTLSHFNVSNFRPGNAPTSSYLSETTVCRLVPHTHTVVSPFIEASVQERW